MSKFLFLTTLLLAVLASCDDNDSFTADPSARLVFSTDTVKMDTVFSTIGSSTYSFWAYNRSGNGLRIANVRLRSGNQTGFRVNVDGSYLDNSTGSVVNGLEVRKGDSIRVFVELTAPETMQADPQRVADDLVFTLESGTQQTVCLQAYAWDALPLRNLVVTGDTTIASTKPVIIYGGITVDSAATLRIENTTLYFHDGAGINVYGKLLTSNVNMRGDRLDHMFDYLPYSRVSGQWGGLHFFESSTGNTLEDTQITSASDALVCDSAALDEQNVRLAMTRCVVHNCKGYGLKAWNSVVSLDHCQFTNTLGDCVALFGGIALIDHCTIAQFYPFSADRGAALRFANEYNGVPYPLHLLQLQGSIVTGYADDVVMGQTLEGDSITPFVYLLKESLLRTPALEDTVNCVDIRWELPTDSIQGKQHFKLIDEDNLDYDFHLDSLSTAQGLGCYE